MQVIAFGHRRQTGKDTAGKLLYTHLQATHKNTVIKKSGFADKLKEVAQTLWGFGGLKSNNFYNQNGALKEQPLEALGLSPRELWIQLGCKIREIYSTTWIDNLLFNGELDILIITDLRFPNEFKKVKEMGGICIKVERDCIEQFDDEADSALKDEDQWDYIIQNNGTLTDLSQTILGLMESFHHEEK